MSVKLAAALTAYEHMSVPVGAGGAASVSAAEADALAVVSMTRRGFCTREAASVRLAQHCGIVPIGTRVAEVLPKTYRTQGGDSTASRFMLLRMLREARRLRLSTHGTATHALARAPLLEVFASAFLESVAAVVRGGLQRRYVARADDLGFVRGRIDIRRQLGALASRPDLVACRFDALLEDHDWNRVLKAALVRLRTTASSTRIAARCAELIAAFVDVSDLRSAEALAIELKYDRQFERYRDAIEWARLILAAMSPSLRAGQAAAAGLLFDMNKLFEEVIGRSLVSAASASSVSARLQSATRHLGRYESDERPAFRLKPDILISDARGLRCIADTKWKLIESERDGRICPAESDVYQMLAYGTAFDVEQLALIYPWHPGIGDSAQQVFRLSGQGRAHTLRVLFVDVETAGYPLRGGSALLHALLAG